MITSLARTWRALLIRSVFAWTAVSFLGIYLLFFLLQGDAWIRIWLKGDSYLTYQAFFVPSLLLGFTMFLRRRRTRDGVAFTIATGGVLGYLCGVIGYLGVVLLLPDGANRLARAVDRYSAFDWMTIVALPALLLNWVLGLTLAMLFLLANRDAVGKKMT